MRDRIFGESNEPPPHSSARLHAFVLTLAMISWILTSAVANEPTHAQESPTETGLDDPVEFVGQDHVDLTWFHTDPCDEIRIYREQVPGDQVPQLIKTVGYSVTFYRDPGRSFAETYQYTVCAYVSAINDETCGKYGGATVGNIHGNLHQPVTRGSDNYFIVNPVYVHLGGALSIGQNAEVMADSSGKLTDEHGGVINVNGAQIGVDTRLTNGESSFSNSTIYDSAYLEVANDISVTGNLITETASINLEKFASAPFQANRRGPGGANWFARIWKVRALGPSSHATGRRR